MSIVGGWVGGPPFFLSSFRFSFFHLHGLLPLSEVRHPTSFYILLLLNVTCFQTLSDPWFSAKTVSIVGGWAVHHFSFSLFASIFSSFPSCMGFSHSSRYAIPSHSILCCYSTSTAFRLSQTLGSQRSGEYSGWVGGPPFSLFSFRFNFLFLSILHGLLPLFEVRHPTPFYTMMLLNINCFQTLSDPWFSTKR